MRYLIHRRPRIAIPALHILTVSALAILPGCGGNGASPADASGAKGPTASAEGTLTEVAIAQGGSMQAALDDSVASYERIATPAGGQAPLTAAHIAAAQAAFDKVGDDLSKL